MAAMSASRLFLDYEQPLFFRSPSSVKQKKKKERAKIGDEASGNEFFFASRSTDCEKIGAARSLGCFSLRGFFFLFFFFCN